MSRTAGGSSTLHLTAPEDRIEELRSVVDGMAGTDHDSTIRFGALPGDGSGTERSKRGTGIGGATRTRARADSVVEDLLGALGLSELQLPRGSPDTPGEGVDYVLRIDSERVLIETGSPAESLDGEGAPIDRLERSLGDRSADARYGIATNGLRWVLLASEETSYECDTLADVSLRGVLARESPGESQDALVRLARFFGRNNLRRIVARSDEAIERRRRAITEEFYGTYLELVFGIVDEETGETTDRSLVRGGVDVPERVEERVENPARLFAVSLVNRLVFVKFLEAKGFIAENLLRELRADYEERRSGDDFYSACLHPLFYGVSGGDYEDGDGTAAFLDHSTAPSGGLFRPVLVHEVDLDDGADAAHDLIRLEEQFAVDDALLFDVLDFLERYRFAAGDGAPLLEDRERPPLDPSVLGNVFEKAINYLAGETGRQKDLGAFYTPDEITGFTAAETIRPVAREKLEATLRERGQGSDEIAEFDALEDLLAALPASADLEAALQGALDTLAICDPACGSGHFLTAVLDEVTAIREAVARNARDSAPTARATAELKRRTIRHNVFGVDVVPPAVEVAGLRLRLSVVDELDPDAIADGDGGIALREAPPNLRVGNSLIGFPDGRDATTGTGDAAFTDLVSDLTFEDVERVAAPGEVAEGVSELTDVAADASVTTVGFYVDGGHPLTDTPSSYTDGTLGELEFTAHKWKAKRSVSGRITEADSAALIEAASTHPEAAVDEVFVERTVSGVDLDGLSRFHWPVEFPETIRDDGFGFDVVVGNPPFGAEIDGLEDRLVEREELFACQGANNSAEYFLERAVQLTRPGGRIGFVLPKTLSYYTTWSEVRSTILDESPPVTLFDNGIAFDGVNYEQVTLVAEPADEPVEEREVDTYVAEDLRDATANAPVHAGSVPLDAMRSRGTFVLRPMTERDREIVAALETNTTPLGDLWAEEPWRGVYVPDSVKAALDDGETAFLERVPSVQRYYLEAEGVWHVDLDDLPERRRASALETTRPRLLFKVLRGSRLHVYPDGTGRFASTEKLVNVPIRRESTPHTLRSLAAALNAPVVSYYLQKLLFSETTETARVMDADYIEAIPIPTATRRQADRLDTVVEHLLFAAQYADDGHGGDRAEEHVDLLARVADALVADLYFGLEAGELRNAVDTALGPLAFDEWADARFAPGDYPLDGSRSRWNAVETGAEALLDADVERLVAAIESDDRLRRIEDVLDG